MTNETTARIEEIRARHEARDAFTFHDIAFLLSVIDRLTRWKNEALPVMDGLQDLGRALDIPPGQRITGPEALAAVERLTADRDADRRENLRLRDDVRRAQVESAQMRLGRGDHR